MGLWQSWLCRGCQISLHSTTSHVRCSTKWCPSCCLGPQEAINLKIGSFKQKVWELLSVDLDMCKWSSLWFQTGGAPSALILVFSVFPWDLHYCSYIKGWLSMAEIVSNSQCKQSLVFWEKGKISSVTQLLQHHLSCGYWGKHTTKSYSYRRSSNQVVLVSEEESWSL